MRGLCKFDVYQYFTLITTESVRRGPLLRFFLTSFSTGAVYTATPL